MLSMAQATRRVGGVVIAQVKRLAKRHTLSPKLVKIPGLFVDLIVVDPQQRQSYLTEYSPGFAGELRVPMSELSPLGLDARKVIARRCAMELYPRAVCNLGAGISTGIARIAAEEGILDSVVLTNEQGLIGGAPAMGVEAGAATNYMAMVDQPYQFDFYDGGGLDLAFLSFAELDANGNVNVSRFGNRVVGFGGFINISQNTPKVLFSGTFTTGGLRLQFDGDQIRILTEGENQKLVPTVRQISYSAKHGRERGQEVLYVTERAVFRLTQHGLELIEIAPGIDVERDIIARMGFRPLLAANLKSMDRRLFRPQLMGLAEHMSSKARVSRAKRLQEFDVATEPRT
jgi:propionate CoA-transferase